MIGLIYNEAASQRDCGANCKSRDAILERRWIEVQQQTNRDAAEPHVRKQLRLMHRHQFFNCLHFYNDSIFDYEIKAITAIQANTFVRNRKGNLSPEIQSPALNLPAKSFFINCFE